MNERISGLRARTRSGAYRAYRLPPAQDLTAECDAHGLSWPARMALLTRRQCEAERVVIGPDERIVFTRTVPTVPAALL